MKVLRDLERMDDARFPEGPLLDAAHQTEACLSIYRHTLSGGVGQTPLPSEYKTRDTFDSGS